MIKRWLRRTAEPESSGAPPDEPPVQVPPDLVAWAQVVDVSRLSDKTVREAEWYLRKYRRMTMLASQETGWRLIATVAAQVSPAPPADAQIIDVLATVLAARRKQLGIE